MRPFMKEAAASSLAEQEVQEMPTPLVEAMVHPDEVARQDNVRRLLAPALLFVIAAVVGRLVALLAGRRDAVRRRAAQSLAEIGSPAAAALTRALVSGRSSRAKQAAAEALTAMLPGHSPERQRDLSWLALDAGLRTGDDAVRLALSRLVAAVRWASEPGDGPYADIAYAVFRRFGRRGQVAVEAGDPS